MAKHILRTSCAFVLAAGLIGLLNTDPAKGKENKAKVGGGKRILKENIKADDQADAEKSSTYCWKRKTTVP